jgi:hypothetical protein
MSLLFRSTFAALFLATAPASALAHFEADPGTAAVVSSQPSSLGSAVPDAPPEAPSSALRPSALSVSLLAPQPAASAIVSEGRYERAIEPMVQSTRNKRGLPFMIAGGAAFVAGLIIGDTAGNLIAAGGAALGVYGIIVYF